MICDPAMREHLRAKLCKDWLPAPKIPCVVSTSSCPVFLTNEMSGWLKLYKVIAKAEIGWFRGISP